MDEKSREIAYLRRSIQDFRKSVLVELDGILARLDRLEPDTKHRPSVRANSKTEWRKFLKQGVIR